MLQISSPELVARVFKTIRVIRESLKVDKGADGHGKCSYFQLATLKFIKDHGRPTMHDLAVYLMITPPSVTSLIKGLTDAGLVVRQTSKEDRRAVHLMLTKKGQAFLDDHLLVVFGCIQGLIAVLSPKERLQLLNIIEKMAASCQ
jgi:DNA-binding MarR family transcriptional regulator